MLPIKRLPSQYPGMSRSTQYGGLVFTVVTADTYDLDMTKQTQEALAKLDKQLAEAGTDKSRLLQTTIYLADMARKPEMNAVWREWVDHDNPPQRACVGAELEEGDLIEIIAIAASKE